MKGLLKMSVVMAAVAAVVMGSFAMAAETSNAPNGATQNAYCTPHCADHADAAAAKEEKGNPSHAGCAHDAETEAQSEGAGRCQGDKCTWDAASTTSDTDMGCGTWAWRYVTHFGCGHTARYYVKLGAVNRLRCPYDGYWFDAYIPY